MFKQMGMMKEALMLQKKLKKITATGEAGKGAVKVTANGAGDIVSIEISEELLTPDKRSKLEKYLIEAINKAHKEAMMKAAQELKDINLPF